MKKTLIIIFSIIIIILISLITFTILYTKRQNIIEYEKFEFNGIIESIYIDDNNHGVTSFYVNDKGNKFYVSLAKWTYASSYTKIGDSIIKKNGSLELIVVKNNKERKSFYYKDVRTGAIIAIIMFLMIFMRLFFLALKKLK